MNSLPGAYAYNGKMQWREISHGAVFSLQKQLVSSLFCIIYAFIYQVS